MILSPNDLNKLVRAIAETREEEIGCNECLEQLDRFVEMKLSGLNVDQAMPLVQDHLNKCGDCREEFEALLEALHVAENTDERTRDTAEFRTAGRFRAWLRRIFGSR